MKLSDLSKTIRISLLVALVFNFAAEIALTQKVRAAGNILFATPLGLTSGNCDSWAAACALPVAIQNAVAGDQVWVKKGTHKPDASDRANSFTLKNGVAIYGGFAGTETALNQRDPAANVTILSGEIGTFHLTDNSYHVVDASGTNSSAILDGFTIVRGYADDSGLISFNDFGGGMLISGGSPILNNMIFSNNHASVNGGGIAILDGSAPTLNNVTFKLDTADVLGGGMFNENSAPNLTNVTFAENTAQSGGGMYNQTSAPTLSDVTFSKNTAESGAGMYNNNASSATLSKVTFSDNTASLDGGGMKNTASSPTLTNVTFFNNKAENDGGGIFNESISNPTLTNVTFTFNIGNGTGGAMSNSNSAPSLTNVILWGNLSPTGVNEVINVNGSAPVIKNSVVQGGCPAGSSCTVIVTSDPKLVPLANNGGFTQTVALDANSSAINKGTNTGCPATDQRGVTRPQGGICDIGGFEMEIVKTTLKSEAGRDGWVLESGKDTNVGGTLNSSDPTIRLGDDAARKQFRSILSFNTSSLPDDAIITKVTLRVRNQGSVGDGDPVTIFGGFMIDIRKGVMGTAALQLTDWQAATSKTVGPQSPAVVGGFYPLNLTSARAFINKLSTNAGLTQIRLRFNVQNNSNAVANTLSLSSGDAAEANRPQLIVEYYVP